MSCPGKRKWLYTTNAATRANARPAPNASLTRRFMAIVPPKRHRGVLVQSELAARSPATYEPGCSKESDWRFVPRNEEHLLPNTLATMPDFVDDVVVVDDAVPIEPSKSRVRWPAAGFASIVIAKPRCGGGDHHQLPTRPRCRRARRGVMAGDAQIHPDDLAAWRDPW